MSYMKSIINDTMIWREINNLMKVDEKCDDIM